jgi:hypothetical protein
MSSATLFSSSGYIALSSMLNSLLAVTVTETHDHLEARDVVTHGSLQT